MYFPDLTPYAYGRAEPQTNVLNVGWLSADHAFPTGDADDRLVDALRQLTKSPLNLFRGVHLCEFCPDQRTPGGRQLMGTAGNGEIRVAGAGGVIYVAPVLVLHYVVAHGYRPPQAFVDAAISAAKPPTGGGGGGRTGQRFNCQ
jgi:hypothetical protein